MITLSSCFYIIKSKYDVSKYIEWMNNFILIVNNFNLVIYTDEKTYPYININNDKIKVIIKPFDQFRNYIYKELWIINHKKNTFLNDKSIHNTDWEINMLWSEKVWFVNETFEKKYFDTEYYGWCDIGYFRNSKYDLHTNQLVNWPNHYKIMALNKNKIYYGCVNNIDKEMKHIENLIKNKNIFGLPKQPIPLNQIGIAGGFFVLHKSKVNWWANTYTEKLKLYLKYFVKDDQAIIIDCVFSQPEHFILYRENLKYDNWFMFQRIFN